MSNLMPDDDPDGIVLLDGAPAYLLGRVKEGRLFFHVHSDHARLFWKSAPGRGSAHDLDKAFDGRLWLTIQVCGTLTTARHGWPQKPPYTPVPVETDWQRRVVWQLGFLAPGEYLLRNQDQELYSIIEPVRPRDKHGAKMRWVQRMIRRERKRIYKQKLKSRLEANR